jgi:hypothetical protein
MLYLTRQSGFLSGMPDKRGVIEKQLPFAPFV